MKEKSNYSILEKDKVWNKIKKYIFILIILLLFLVLLLLILTILQGITLRKIIDYTSSSV